MPKISSPRQYGLIAAAASGKSTKASGLSQAEAGKMLHETPKPKRKKFAQALANKRKRRTHAMEAFGGR